MNQKSIGIFMILYDNPLCWKEYQLCRSFYERMISIYGMPITIYGVCYENVPQDVVEYGCLKLSATPQEKVWKDADTMRKWYDLIKSPALPEHDVYIRLTPSTALNIHLLNTHIQSPMYNPDTVYASYFYHHMIEGDDKPYIYPRGNLVVMSRDMIRDMVKDFTENSIEEVVRAGAGIHDDHMIGTSLFRYHYHNFKSYKMCSVYEDEVPRLSDNLQLIHDVMCVNCKINGINQEAGTTPLYILEVMKMVLSMWESHYWVQIDYGEPFRGTFYNHREDMEELFRQAGY